MVSRNKLRYRKDNCTVEITRYLNKVPSHLLLDIYFIVELSLRVFADTYNKDVLWRKKSSPELKITLIVTRGWIFDF